MSRELDLEVSNFKHLVLISNMTLLRDKKLEVNVGSRNKSSKWNRKDDTVPVTVNRGSIQ